jgi:hypothetical protein
MASAAGITFLASSGDSGSADCSDRSGIPTHHLTVNYPASSWWVTGVGGTNIALNSGTNTLAGQVVWNDDALQPGSAGGGGLSRVFRRPNYQNGTVKPNSRAVPDVAMLADIVPGYAIFCSASSDCVSPRNPNPWSTVGGTSAGTPLLAGAFALVDQQLQAAGRADLGLVNPLLYSIGRSSDAATVFSDVTAGSNDVFPFVGGKPLGCCSAGPGFDFASGWGSVNVANFATVASARQPQLVHFALSVPPGQSALAAHGIKADVSCSAACLLGAYSEVKVAGFKPFEVDSFVAKLTAAAPRPCSCASPVRRSDSCGLPGRITAGSGRPCSASCSTERSTASRTARACRSGPRPRATPSASASRLIPRPAAGWLIPRPAAADLGIAAGSGRVPTRTPHTGVCRVPRNSHMVFPPS